jgi:AraC-like DNA-binding protein
LHTKDQLSLLPRFGWRLPSVIDQFFKGNRTMLFTEVGGPSATQSRTSVGSEALFINSAGAQLPPPHPAQGRGIAPHGIAAQLRLHRGGLPPRALQRVREFIEAHLEENISIQALADIAGLSMCHFARAFKQSEGMTPHDYLVQCRVRRAQELLAGTDLPLSQIAIAVGFADQSHCARRFREHVGLTPSRYRWSMR